MHKRNLMFIIIIVTTILIILLYPLIIDYKQHSNMISDIKKISLEISKETYENKNNSIKRYSVGEAQERLIEIKEKNFNNKIKFQQIDISSFVEIEEKIIITTKIQEEPFKTVIFYEFTYEKINGKWMVVNFNCDV